MTLGIDTVPSWLVSAIDTPLLSVFRTTCVKAVILSRNVSVLPSPVGDIQALIGVDAAAEIKVGTGVEAE